MVVGNLTIERLVEAGCPATNLVDNHRRTPWSLAAEHGRLSPAKYLIHLGVRYKLHCSTGYVTHRAKEYDSCLVKETWAVVKGGR